MAVSRGDAPAEHAPSPSCVGHAGILSHKHRQHSQGTQGGGRLKSVWIGRVQVLRLAALSCGTALLLLKAPLQPDVASFFTSHAAFRAWSTSSGGRAAAALVRLLSVAAAGQLAGHAAWLMTTATSCHQQPLAAHLPLGIRCCRAHHIVVQQEGHGCVRGRAAQGGGACRTPPGASCAEAVPAWGVAWRTPQGCQLRPSCAAPLHRRHRPSSTRRGRRRWCSPATRPRA